VGEAREAEAPANKIGAMRPPEKPVEYLKRNRSSLPLTTAEERTRAGNRRTLTCTLLPLSGYLSQTRSIAMISWRLKGRVGVYLTRGVASLRAGLSLIQALPGRSETALPTEGSPVRPRPISELERLPDRDALEVTLHVDGAAASPVLSSFMPVLPALKVTAENGEHKFPLYDPPRTMGRMGSDFAGLEGAPTTGAGDRVRWPPWAWFFLQDDHSVSSTVFCQDRSFDNLRCTRASTDSGTRMLA
jgi:hypothetical protein